MDKWRNLPLDEIANIVTGTTPKGSNPDDWGDTIDFLTPSDQIDGYREVAPARRLSELGAARYQSRIVPAGSTALTCIASVGKVSMTREPTLTNQQINTLVAKPAIMDPNYLYYMILHWSPQLQLHASGSATPIVNKSTLSTFDFLIPPLAVQQAVGEVLGALDDKIAANGELGETCESLAKQLVRRIQTQTPLRELVKHHRATVTPADMPQSLVSHYSLPAYDNGRLPERVAPASIKSNKYRIEAPSVLVSRLNPRFPRYWNVAETDGPPALASTEFMVLEPVWGTTALLWAAISQPSFSSALQGKVAGTSGSHQRVRPADLLDTAIIDISKVEEQSAESINGLVARAESARNESTVLAATRDALLPALMSGKLRVKDAERLVEAVV